MESPCATGKSKVSSARSRDQNPKPRGPFCELRLRARLLGGPVTRLSPSWSH